MRVTTLYAGTAVATARYYTRYLTEAPGERPGVWFGAQAVGLGLAGEVSTDALELLLLGRDPSSGELLGFPLADRVLTDGRVVRAVAGFDVTLSAPKSLSVWWALTGDDGLLSCHDVAVRAVIRVVEQFGSTTRVRSNGRRLHLDSQGLVAAVFPQTTSRLDDPQIHTHVVVSSKVQTDDGRWMALDARVLKRYQRALGGLYQSVLRAEVTHRYGVAWGPIVKGQAEIAGVEPVLLEVFSKRAAQVHAALEVKLDEFYVREGRDASRLERARMERDAAADTRHHKTHTAIDVRSRWLDEAFDAGFLPNDVTRDLSAAARSAPVGIGRTPVEQVVAELEDGKSVWHRFDILRALTDHLRPEGHLDGTRWAATLDLAADEVLAGSVNLDPALDGGPRRRSDGRSVWIEPVAAQVTTERILAQEEAILAWALDAQLAPPYPSSTVGRIGLDERQGDAAAAVAGTDPLVVVVGPAGAGKTTMLRAAAVDLEEHGRAVFGVSPTAKAARVLERETGIPADTVAKLLHEWRRPDGPQARWHLGAGTTVIVDEAGMLATSDLHNLIELAGDQRWRVALVGDPRQLHAVGRGGMFDEICTTARTYELTEIHRFSEPWEAAASLRLRNGDLRVLDTYAAHARITPGTLREHLAYIAQKWLIRHSARETLAITTTTNDHVDLINHTIQHARIQLGQLRPDHAVPVAGGERVMVGDTVMTRRNRRDLTASDGEPVRNRDLWTVRAIDDDGTLYAVRHDSTAIAELPPDYTRQHVRLGYATTEPGNQADTRTASITLATSVTTARGLYVGMTRGRTNNHVLALTDTHHPGDARDLLATILTVDRTDHPAIAHRLELRRRSAAAPVPAGELQPLAPRRTPEHVQPLSNVPSIELLRTYPPPSPVTELGL